MIELSPKAQFLRHAEKAGAFREMMAHPVMQEAITYATSQLIHNPVTTEELNGAKQFILIFCGLAEEPVKITEPPVRELKTIGQTVIPKEPVQEAKKKK